MTVSTTPAAAAECPVLPALTGWDETLKGFVRGQRIWSVPDQPSAPRTIPWPVTWCLAVLWHGWAPLVPDDDGEPALQPDAGPAVVWSNEDRDRGWRGGHAVCPITGERIDLDTGVRCVRCGLPLSARAAGYNSQDIDSIPTCSSCRPAVAHLIKTLTASTGLTIRGR